MEISTTENGYIISETAKNISEQIIPTLQDLNDEEIRRRMPPMIFLGILSLIGIPGNIAVLMVFLSKSHRCSHETFILGLAWIDLTACAVCMPFEILEMTFQYTFYAENVCKVFRFGDKLVAYGSIFVIIALSYDRYRRVCRPFMNQMTVAFAKGICVFAIFISSTVSWPTIFLSGTRLVDLDYNITGYDCSTSDTYRDTEFPFIHNIVLFAVFIACLVTLCVLYICIGREIFAHFQFRSIFISTTGSPKCKRKYNIAGARRQSNATTSGIELVEMRPKSNSTNSLEIRSKSNNIKNVEMRPKSNSTQLMEMRPNSNSTHLAEMRSKSSSSQSLLKDLLTIHKHPLTEEEKERRKSRKVTKIAFLIMISFIFSYLPHMLIVTMTAIKRGFLVKPGPISSSLLPLAVRSFFINNVINPFIYGICDSHFRYKLKHILCKMFRSLKCR